MYRQCREVGEYYTYPSMKPSTIHAPTYTELMNMPLLKRLQLVSCIAEVRPTDFDC